MIMLKSPAALALLGLITFIGCCIGGVSGDAPNNITIIQSGTYADSTCTTPAPILLPVTNATAGECRGGIAAAYTDGSFVYNYYFSSGTNCAVANITYAIKIPVGVCGASVAYSGGFTMYKLYTGSVNPTLPGGAFPPNGFTTITQYVNSTDGTADNTCTSSVTNVIASPTPVSTGSCQISEDGLFSYQNFLGTTCTYLEQARYSDPNCTNVAQVFTQTEEYKSCNNGVKQTCTSAGAPSLESLSSTLFGVYQYDNNQCIENSQTQQTYVVPGACFQGMTVTCATVNGTQMLVANNYVNSNCTGNINKMDYLPTGSCIQGGENANITATCIVNFPIVTGSSTGPGSPSVGTVGRTVSFGSWMMVIISGLITMINLN